MLTSINTLLQVTGYLLRGCVRMAHHPRFVLASEKVNLENVFVKSGHKILVSKLSLNLMQWYNYISSLIVNIINYSKRGMIIA